MKKFFIITAVLFGVFLLFFFIYNFLFVNNALQGKVPNVAMVSNDTTPSTPKKDDASVPKIAAFTDGDSVAPFFDAKDGVLLYLAPDEQSLKETFVITGSSKTVATFPFTPQNILWSSDGGKALVKKSDTEWALFTRGVRADDGSPLQILKTGIESPAWTALGDAIVYKYYDPSTKKRTLNIANPDGSDWKMIGEVNAQFLEMRAIPKSSLVAYWNRGNAFEKTSLNTFSVVGGEPKEIFSTNYGADYVVAPNGNAILMSSLVEKGGSNISMAVINTDGGGYRNLFIPSLVGKAVWSKNSRIIYYALPGDIPPGSILPNDYYRKPILTSDTFWKMDTQTAEASRVVDPTDIDQNYDAESLTLDTDETMLFFRNRRDGKIYRVNL